MIGLRVRCDADGCERHFDVGQTELSVTAAIDTSRDRAAIIVGGALVALPQGWAVGEEQPGIVLVLCASHAARMS